jgi:hypothetical protein
MRATLFAVVLACGCAAPTATPAAASQSAAPRAEDAAVARQIAVEVAAKAQYSPKDYRVVATKRMDAETWAVFFEHVPPVPPGGHCTVYVRVADGSARLVHGE